MWIGMLYITVSNLSIKIIKKKLSLSCLKPFIHVSMAICTQYLFIFLRSSIVFGTLPPNWEKLECLNAWAQQHTHLECQANSKAENLSSKTVNIYSREIPLDWQRRQCTTSVPSVVLGEQYKNHNSGTFSGGTAEIDVSQVAQEGRFLWMQGSACNKMKSKLFLWTYHTHSRIKFCWSKNWQTDILWLP